MIKSNPPYSNQPANKQLKVNYKTNRKIISFTQNIIGMGCVASTEEDKKSKAFDKKLKEDGEKAAKDIKLLLLGMVGPLE